MNQRMSKYFSKGVLAGSTFIVLVILFINLFEVRKAIQNISVWAKQQTPYGSWEVAKEERNTPQNAEYFFGYFLAIQSEYVYELSNMDIHTNISKWMSENGAVACSHPPFSVGSSLTNEMRVMCECTLVIDRIVSEFDIAKGHYVVSEFNDLSYRTCR